MTQTTRGTLDLDNGTLAYEVAGEGEALVLSHPAFFDSRMFDAQWDVLAQQFRVIRYDLRGYGQSSDVQGPVDRRADLRQLLKHLDVMQAHFVGCSLSGEFMLDMALETPELVKSLTVVDATPSGFELQGEPPRYIQEMFGLIQSSDVDRANELQIRIWFDGNYREPDQVDQTLREKALKMNRSSVERKTYFADLEPVNPLNPPAAMRLKEIACPTLIVMGGLEHPELLRAADVMAEQIPNAQKVIVEGTAHLPSYEKPDEFNRILLDFLRAQQTSR